ncbi:interleukin-1 receptor type 2 [Chanos chanos]|uniref:Interleukin-1 receptor type 2 n=1 Tax=Chanos chanos TaxID=29144 RepID=A0A6J2WGH2_CHACN|nr:interleukin-1 receptor type 2 [Chanos chanos]
MTVKAQVNSGNYTCVIRSGDICFTGQISLNVYETERADINIISYPAHIQAGSDAWLKCPDLEDFVRMENPRWYKDSSDTMLPIGGGRYNREGNDTLIIRNLSAADSGLYTCRLRVLINNNLYDISRIWKLEVPVSPGKQSADSIMVTWLINGQSIEETDLGGRVFQGERRVKGGNVEVWLVFLEVLEEDTGVELSCVTQSPLGKHEVVTMVKSEDSVLTWLTVGIVSSVCFLLVLSVFLYHLKPRRREKQGDYILARNDSLF